jgi:hypothetical protein
VLFSGSDSVFRRKGVLNTEGHTLISKKANVPMSRIVSVKAKIERKKRTAQGKMCIGGREDLETFWQNAN